MLAVLKKELKTYYSSLFAYLYYGVFFLVTGIFFVTNCLVTYSTQFGYYVLSRSFLVVAAIIPFCTMRLFASERRSKTDQLLFTAPVSTFCVLAGKYLATVIFVLLPVLASGIYPCWIAGHGEMSIRFLMGSYIGVCLVTLVLLSIGMFISSLTANPVLAAVMTFAVYLVILLSRLMESIVVANDGWYQFFHDSSIYNKYNDMVSGIVRSGDIIYLLLLAVCFFLLTWLALEIRRQSRKKISAYMAVVIAGSLVISLLSLSHTRVIDCTAEGLLTLSEQTKQAVSEIDKTTDIYYIGLRSRANATYQELLKAYENLSDNITIHYKDISTDSAFRKQYLADVSSVSESSMVVVCGEKYIYLSADDYVTTTQTSAYSYDRTLEIEEQLTRAIVYTNTGEADKLCVAVGNGEEELNSGFKNLLLLNNYEFEEVNLPDTSASIQGAIPEDCTALLINAPQSDYSEEEIAILEDYLKSGGKLFVTIDPLNEDLERFTAFLKEYGMDVQPGIVIEQDAGRYVYDTQYYLAPEIEDTEYTREILDENLTVLTMTSKGILKNGGANGYTCTDILTTGSTAYSKVNDFDDLTTKAEDDISGPFSVASCAENPDEGSLFLITSNIFFNEEADTESQGANRKFFIEILRQITGTEANVWIEGKDVGSQMALYPNGTQTMVKVVTVIVVPVCIILLGILILLLRHKNISLYRLRKRKQNEENE